MNLPLFPRTRIIKTPIFIAFFAASCARAPDSGYSLAVTDGGPVTDPDQAPGTYGLHYYYQGQPVGAASVVAVSPNTLVTNGHVVQNNVNGLSYDQIVIKDYKGSEVTSFQANDPGLRRVINPGFFSQDQAVSDKSDIGAFVLPSAIPQEKLTHGVMPLSGSSVGVNQTVQLAGNGVSDYKALNPAEVTANNNSGIMRWGTNSISEVEDDGGYFMEGFAFDTPNESGRSVSGPGDSGGSVFAIDPDGNKKWVGIMEGGKMFSGSDGQYQYFDTSNVSEIKNQPNSAYGYVVDVNKQQSFFSEVVRNGGEVGGYESSQAIGPADPTYVYREPSNFNNIAVNEIAPPPSSN